MLLSNPALAREMPAKPVGHVSFETHSADVGVGYTWGEGKLTYGHHTDRFKIKGGTAVSLGYSSLEAEGEVPLKLTSKATGARLAAGLQGVNFEIEN